MRGVLTAALLLALLLLAAGCARTEKEIAQTIEDYERALRERDVVAVCTLVVPREIATPSREGALPQAARACRRSFEEESFAGLSGVGLEFAGARITGGRAQVAVRTSDGRRLGFEMARLADRWRIVRPSTP